MDDVRAVMDAVGTERAAVFGYHEGGPMSMLFAGHVPGAHAPSPLRNLRGLVDQRHA